MKSTPQNFTTHCFFGLTGSQVRGSEQNEVARLFRPLHPVLECMLPVHLAASAQLPAVAALWGCFAERHMNVADAPSDEAVIISEVVIGAGPVCKARDCNTCALARLPPLPLLRCCLVL